MDFVISDIHGCYYSLLDLLDKIKLKDSNPQLVFVGDYIDRGKFSKEVIDLVISLQENGAVCLRGNHDDVVDWILNQESVSDISELCVRMDDYSVVSWWLQNGFGPTLKSYNTDTTYRIDEIVQSFRKSVPESHKKFLRNLELYWMNDTHFACHASYPTDREEPRDVRFFKNELKNDTLWTRFNRDLSEVKTVWDKIGVFGHTPTWYYGRDKNNPVCIFHDKIRLIDLGCFAGGCLAAYCCQDDSVISVFQNEKDKGF